MNTHDVIRESLGTAHHIVISYLSDLTDTDFMQRPVQAANHIAWQLGHLISSEYGLMEQVKPGLSPKLPAGFLEAYTKETSKMDDQSRFHSKAEYLHLYNRQRNATLQILEGLSEPDLDKPGPESMRAYAPTVGSIMLLQGIHELMHGGQFVAVRRKLNKPVLI